MKGSERVYLATMVCISGRDDLLAGLARSGRSKTNAARNLRAVIRKHAVALPVEIDVVKIRIRRRKPRVQDIDVWWPVLNVRSWVEVLLQQYPQFLLAGYKLADESSWRKVFEEFWENMKIVDPTHPALDQLEDCDRGTSIPVFSHGDEGQSHRRSAFMVESWQPAVSYQGLSKTNMSGTLGLYRRSIASDGHKPHA